MDTWRFGSYVLVLLFLKIASDRAAEGLPLAIVPDGCSFENLAALEVTPDLGARINREILEPLARANNLSGFPDFSRLDRRPGGERTERLPGLIALLAGLDFSRDSSAAHKLFADLLNRFVAVSDERGHILTPPELARLAARILCAAMPDPARATTIYDPTCGTGGLLLAAASEVERQGGAQPMLFGQDNDATAVCLARLNILIHGHAKARIRWGNTLTTPLFLEGSGLRTFDCIVAHPPFSDGEWSSRFDPAQDRFRRFEGHGLTAATCGDFAYLLHVLHSLKPGGQALCILPLDVLSRGGVEAGVRRSLVADGVIRAVIALPEKLFPRHDGAACLLLIDRQAAERRDAVFMIDASRDSASEAGRNRLREEDVLRIAETFAAQNEVPGFARLVPVTEIAAAESDHDLTPARYAPPFKPQPKQEPEPKPKQEPEPQPRPQPQRQPRPAPPPSVKPARPKPAPADRGARAKGKTMPPATWAVAVALTGAVILLGAGAAAYFWRPPQPAPAVESAPTPKADLGAEIDAELAKFASFQALKAEYPADYERIAAAVRQAVLKGSMLEAALTTAPPLVEEVMRREVSAYGMASVERMRDDIRARLPVMNHLQAQQGARACNELAVNGVPALRRLLGEGFYKDKQLVSMADALDANFIRTAAEGRRLRIEHKPLGQADWEAVAHYLISKGMAEKDFSVFADPAKSVEDPSTCGVFMRFMDLVTAPGSDAAARVIPFVATAATAGE